MPTKYIQDTKSLKFAKIIHAIIPYIFLSLLGTILWSLTYVCLYFYKEVLLCYIKIPIKFEGQSYLNKLKEYKTFLPRVILFNFILIFFWLIILLSHNEWKFYIIKSGFIFFIIFFVVYWCYYYKYYNYKNDFFDDYYYIMNYFKNKVFNKNENNKNKDIKAKIE